MKIAKATASISFIILLALFLAGDIIDSRNSIKEAGALIASIRIEICQLDYVLKKGYW